MGADILHPTSVPLLTLDPLHRIYSPPFLLLKGMGRVFHKPHSSHGSSSEGTDSSHG